MQAPTTGNTSVEPKRRQSTPTTGGWRGGGGRRRSSLPPSYGLRSPKINPASVGGEDGAKELTVLPEFEPKDDLDIMLQHEDFPALITLVVKVKAVRQQIADLYQRSIPYQKRGPASRLQPQDVMAAVDRLQQQLLAEPQRARTIPRGLYPISDSIMDDAHKVLQLELDHCQRCLAPSGETHGSNHGQETSMDPLAPSPSSTKSSARKKRDRSTKSAGIASPDDKEKKKDAIAIKYSKWQTDILMNWMIQNKEQPFPDQRAIEVLMQKTGLSQSQVINWTTNVRKRNRKATCEGGKKPHHFIDFLFLAQDRENRRLKAVPPTSSPGGEDQVVRAMMMPPPPPSSSFDSSSTQKMRPTKLDFDEGWPEDVSKMPLRLESPTEQQTHPHSSKGPAPSWYEDSIDAYLAASDRSTHLFDDTDPLRLDDATDELLLKEFSDDWLNDESKIDFTEGSDDGMALDDLFMSLAPLAAPLAAAPRHPYHQHPLLPSVTDDSTESIDEHPGPVKRPRLMSFDLGSMDEGDVGTWAAELGLPLES